MKKFNAFTLAEVLITLGIIGVVAAMTMPTLINQTNGAQYKAAYKKALSALSQAITLNVALDDVSFADINNTDDDRKLDNVLRKRMNVVNPTTSAGYDLPTDDISISYKYTCKEDDEATACSGQTTGTSVDRTGTIKASTQNKFLFFNDSSMFAYTDTDTASGCTPKNQCLGIIDVNGAKGPNKVVSDANNPTDIYPVVFYDQTVLPASDVASKVLYNK